MVSLTAADGRNITVSTTTDGGTGTGLITTVVGGAPNSAATTSFKLNGVDIPVVPVLANFSNVKTDGAAGAETNAMTFGELAAGQTMTVNGLSFTAGAAGTTAAQTAAAFSGIADTGVTAATITVAKALNSSTLGTFSGTFAAGWATGAVSNTSVVTATSSVNGNVTDLPLTAAAVHGAQIAFVINSKTAQTGVTATAAASGVLTLSTVSSDGRGIDITGTLTNTGLSANNASKTAAITLSTNGDKGIVIGGTTGAASTGQALNVG
ncbi:MAG: hypothetical protein EBY23_13175, partial [Actinobacteria bacterium]|nr:hypothetical protein [Actinomycetota bacterium]